MTQRINELRRAWDEREQRLGGTKRAVLFKRFPNWLNESIHRRHMGFIVRHLPVEPTSFLDVGCGYGRISRELKPLLPAARFQGIDLCAGFAQQYRTHVGPCFTGSVDDFQTNSKYDVILVVTLLMYVDLQDQASTLERLWAHLVPGGCLICIEPAIEILTTFRRLTGKRAAAPTGGDVYHFRRDELHGLAERLPGANIAAAGSVRLIPFLSVTALHHCLAVNRAAGETAST